MSYEGLVRSRICDPLDMMNTRITLTPDMKARLAVGHGATLNAVPNWDLPTFAGAGALRSTVNDMLTFLAANLGYTKTPLSQAMADEVAIRRPIGAQGMEIAYGWHIQTKEGRSIIWHNGGTGGYRSYMGYDPKARTGVVVLSNLSSAEGPDDIGRHLLNASYPLLEIHPPAEHKEITLDIGIFDKYVGTYKLNQSAALSVSRSEGKFYTQLTGQPKIEMFAEGERRFFLKLVDAQLSFDVDPKGEATQVTLHQGGLDQVAKRLSGAEIQKFTDDIAAHDADVAKRFKDQKQSDGTEAAVRRAIRELQAGEPNYDLMSPQFAAVTRQQLPTLKSTIAQFGNLESVTFKGVGPGGADIYEVKFAQAKTEWRIMLGADGKTMSLGFRPL
jgi:hypothetical protein